MLFKLEEKSVLMEFVNGCINVNHTIKVLLVCPCGDFDMQFFFFAIFQWPSEKLAYIRLYSVYVDEQWSSG